MGKGERSKGEEKKLQEKGEGGKYNNGDRKRWWRWMKVRDKRQKKRGCDGKTKLGIAGNNKKKG